MKPLDAIVSIAQVLIRMDLAPGATPTSFAIRFAVERATILVCLDDAATENKAVAELERRYTPWNKVREVDAIND